MPPSRVPQFPFFQFADFIGVVENNARPLIMPPEAAFSHSDPRFLWTIFRKNSGPKPRCPQLAYAMVVDHACKMNGFRTNHTTVIAVTRNIRSNIPQIGAWCRDRILEGRPPGDYQDYGKLTWAALAEHGMACKKDPKTIASMDEELKLAWGSSPKGDGCASWANRKQDDAFCTHLCASFEELNEKRLTGTTTIQTIRAMVLEWGNREWRRPEPISEYVENAVRQIT